MASAQLSGAVGPTTPLAAKRTTICNVLDYGGKIGTTDIGPAISAAFNQCVKVHSGSTLYVPPGNYGMATWVTLDDGVHWAFQMDGFITRTATTGGHMIIIENANDFEFYSSTSAGTIQGLGYECRDAGPRLIRMVTSTNWSLHDLILVDCEFTFQCDVFETNDDMPAPEFHLIVQGGSNGEIYNLAIRGANIGGSDGVDISGTNHWVHDVEVTNRDECVTVKSPASDFLIENIYCNQSGGSAIGSLGEGTAIENIVYRNVYTNGGNQIFMIKSNGGSGYVTNVLFQNFLATGTAYGLNIDQYWAEMATAPGDGVMLSNIKFESWNGIVENGVQRPPYRFQCADGAPCTNITVADVNLLSSTGAADMACRSAFGTGACLKSGKAFSYEAKAVANVAPVAYSPFATLSGDLTDGFTSTASIPAPTIPSTFYPGVTQISPLAKNISRNVLKLAIFSATTKVIIMSTKSATPTAISGAATSTTSVRLFASVSTSSSAVAPTTSAKPTKPTASASSSASHVVSIKSSAPGSTRSAAPHLSAPASTHPAAPHSSASTRSAVHHSSASTSTRSFAPQSSASASTRSTARSSSAFTSTHSAAHSSSSSSSASSSVALRASSITPSASVSATSATPSKGNKSCKPSGKFTNGKALWHSRQRDDHDHGYPNF
ncbi:hypothetical protein HWV62_11271 [Athelia sp. TMB]|nr:hypothetical protein HWV62_11271 [Athelia sp. TMB]